jgi:hypothetical protein
VKLSIESGIALVMFGVCLSILALALIVHVIASNKCGGA